tara:strand:- start:211 stop:357 length:147 start_codon:yes stop_codon:yes gene_type:complete
MAVDLTMVGAKGSGRPSGTDDKTCSRLGRGIRPVAGEEGLGKDISATD